MADPLKIPVIVAGADVAQMQLGKVERAIEDVGDEATLAGRKADRLGRDIDDLGDEALRADPKVRRLARSLENIDDADGPRRTTAGVRDLRKELDKAEISAGKAGKALKSLGDDKASRGLSQFTGGISGIVSAVPKPVLGVVGGGALVGAGGVAGAAVLSGAALGGIAGGVALAAQQDRVKNAFAGLAQEVMRDLSADAGAFAAPLVRTAEIFGDAWRRVQPEVAKTFRELADDVEPLAEGLAGGAEKAIRGIGKAARESEPVTRQLGETFDRIGGSVGEFFEVISTSAPESARALELLTDGMDLLIASSGGTIAATAEMAGGFAELNESLGGGLLGLTGVYSEMRKGSRDAEEHADKANNVANSYDRIQAEAEAAGKAIRDGIQATTDSLDSILDVNEATLAAKQSFFDLAEAVKENGRSLDVTKEKGIANRQVLDDMIQRHLDVRKAAIASGDGTAASAQKADAQLKVHLEQIRQWALKLGFPKAEIDAILSKYLKLLEQPNITKRVTIEERGQRFIPPASLPGRPVGFSKGGVVRHAQAGLLSRAGIFSGGPPLYAFAEPETGGEAFIPRRGDRSRNLSILSTAAAWNDAAVVPRGARMAMAGGGGSVIVRQPVQFVLGTRVIHEELIEFALNTGRTPAQLWQDRR